MKALQIDIKPKNVTKPLQEKKRFIDKINKNSSKFNYKKYLFIMLGVFVIGGLSFGGFWVYKTLSAIERTGINTDPTKTIINTLTNKDPELLKDKKGLTSVLAVGVDTNEYFHGLYNTDSIIIITLNHKTDVVTMISIPRDMWVENPRSPGYYTKINAVYSLCESNNEGDGMPCLVETAEMITGLEIQYHGMIDVNGFIKVIDTIGGIEVDVERAFTDYMFPNKDYTGYEVISFEAGPQQMDGTTAMKYARSRYSQSVEGSDFARARRQQRVIIATKQKLLSTETLLDPKKIIEIMDTVSDSIKVSRIDTEDIRAGLLKIQKIDKGSMYSMVLDPMSGNWSLIMEDPSAAYILTPKLGPNNWQDVHEFVNAYVSNPILYTERAKVYIYNGGLGYFETQQKALELMAQYPFLDITFAGNSALQTYQGTSIYSFSEETKFETLNQLDNFFSQKHEKENPDTLQRPYGVDIIVILGAPEPISPEPISE